MKTKICNICNKEKDISNFHKNGIRNGIQYYKNQCKECRTISKRKWAQENKEKLNSYQRKYISEKGTDGVRTRMHKHRSSKFNVDFESFSISEMLNDCDWKCQNCGCKVHNERFPIAELKAKGLLSTKATIDHIISLSNGGDTLNENLQILCYSCNSKKSNND